MSKTVFFTLCFLFFHNSFARSGNGAGNGGLGYVCENKSVYSKTTLSLDIFEELRVFYFGSHFHTQFDMAAHKLPHLILPVLSANSLDPNKLEYEYQILTKSLKAILQENINLNEPILRGFFSEKVLLQIKDVKDRIVNEAVFKYEINNKNVKNKTFDQGTIVMPEQETLSYFGLYNCEFGQLAKLNNNQGKLTLKLYLGSILYMDDLNLKALLWHEIIYFAVPDLDSSRVRALVRRILEHIN